MKSWKLTLLVTALSLAAGSASPQDIFDAVKGSDLAKVGELL